MREESPENRLGEKWITRFWNLLCLSYILGAKMRL